VLVLLLLPTVQGELRHALLRVVWLLPVLLLLLLLLLPVLLLLLLPVLLLLLLLLLLPVLLLLLLLLLLPLLLRQSRELAGAVACATLAHRMMGALQSEPRFNQQLGLQSGRMIPHAVLLRLHIRRVLLQHSDGHGHDYRLICPILAAYSAPRYILFTGLSLGAARTCCCTPCRPAPASPSLEALGCSCTPAAAAWWRGAGLDQYAPSRDLVPDAMLPPGQAHSRLCRIAATTRTSYNECDSSLYTCHKL
jgi:hypothetical protein